MADSLSFTEGFHALTGHEPFPWQKQLYERFLAGEFPPCNLPTGLGKTSVIAVWLLALVNQREGVDANKRVPRRLVYVVNRRTVVDQTTSEAEKLRNRLVKRSNAVLAEIADRLRNLAGPGASDSDSQAPLAISTLRGQYADNREWSVNPARPAVICGTVDMIGSRLLFSGYGVGFKSKPLHAGFLGQDVLLVHDEAHLEPAFQELIGSIRREQQRCGEFAVFHVMELTATTRSEGQGNAKTLGLTKEEMNPPEQIPEPADGEPSIHHVWRRLRATKNLCFTPVVDEKQAPGEIAKIAASYKGENAAVLVFVRTLEAVSVFEKALKKTECDVILLTGTMRGKERDELVEKSAFKRFFKTAKPAEPGQTVYLVCTSAGEVGIDISADHMVCDLSTFESMAQRLGRVNRYGVDRKGRPQASRIDVVHPAKFGKQDKKTGKQKASEIDKSRGNTLGLLKRLPALGKDEDCKDVYDASPKALAELTLTREEREAAFAPTPTILPVTDILFDAWAMTSIRGKLPGRPPVGPYLHGIAELPIPETRVAWREEVGVIVGDLAYLHSPRELLDDYPLMPREMLRDRTDRVWREIAKLAGKHENKNKPVWIVDDEGTVEVVQHVSELADLQKKDAETRIAGKTILLPLDIGGLTEQGTLDGDAHPMDKVEYDVADVITSPTSARVRVWSDDPDCEKSTTNMRRVRSIAIDASDDDEESRRWEWFERLPLEGGRTARKPVTLETHVGDVVNHVRNIVGGLPLPEEIADAVILAAELHDHGKSRERFQKTLGNRRYPDVLLAKSGRRGGRLPEPFRHEFASLLDARVDDRFNALDDQMQDLVLHLIAAHHGRARPHFPSDEALDPNPPSEISPDETVIETPRRFARLQRTYGRWGLAYLESLLRAADWAASAEPSKVLDANGNEVAP